MGMSGKRHTPANLRPGITRYPLYRKVDCSRCRSGRVQLNLSRTRIRSPDIKPITCRYNEYAIPVLVLSVQ
jgi:hypothetical protein